MLKYFYLSLLLNLCFFNIAKCQHSDTTVLYFKFNSYAYSAVPTLKEADFVRFITLPDSGDTKYNVAEYYKSGKVKLLGKYDEDYSPENAGRLSGKCITYFPNGKRESIITYDAGRKVGDEYLYYPNGKLYCVKNNTLPKDIYHPVDIEYVECYDSTGMTICSGGNGKWIMYNKRFNITEQGTIKKGRFDGDWNGVTQTKYPTKYTKKYHAGDCVSGIGYDINGKAFPFKDTLEVSHSVLLFAFSTLHRFEGFKGLDKANSSIDTAEIYFVIEKDGRMTNLKVIGCDQSGQMSFLQSVMDKNQKMFPMIYYGIPMRSEVTIPYKQAIGYINKMNQFNRFLFNEKMLRD